MDILDLEQELRDKTLCDISNIKVKKIDGEMTICIDEFRITESTEGDYKVSDTNETFEDFETTPERIVETLLRKSARRSNFFVSFICVSSKRLLNLISAPSRN